MVLVVVVVVSVVSVVEVHKIHLEPSLPSHICDIFYCLRLSTVCHGDLWSGNLVFQPRPGDSPGLDCSLLQPQAAASLSPATDLVHLVLTSGPADITELGGQIFCSGRTQHLYRKHRSQKLILLNEEKEKNSPKNAKFPTSIKLSEKFQ